MRIVNHPLCTTTIGAPSDMQDDCSALPVAYHTDEYGTWAVSFWQPSADELATLAADGGITLQVRALGRQHPVVAMGVYPSISPVPQARTAIAAALEDSRKLRQLRAFEALLPAAPGVRAADREEFIRQVVNGIAEMDRDSPEDQPEMMLVTPDELRGCLENAFQCMDEDAELATDLIAIVAQQASQLSDALRDVVAERHRQVEQEGHGPEHDDAYPNGEIAAYAAFYAMPPAAREWPATETGYGATFGEAIVPSDWTAPKTGERRRELVMAGALILAEIERIDRKAIVWEKAAA